MKIRESGMPKEKIWEGFFNPVKILKILGMSKSICDVEFGCGFGTFTIPTAKMISGKIYAIDLEPEMLKITRNKVIGKKLENVVTVQQDFLTKGSSLNSESVDYVILFNILHEEEPERLFEESWRILKPMVY
ncbi:MAG: class I SAM-dependent methyltransferase [Nitrosopumilus sp.]|nr:class I SAM-dependent methyltransferase [Nitrosopumilus sp.]MDH3487512.1 class I SAM-dependent methyltransferase [Nitrosopumilus sp.]